VYLPGALPTDLLEETYPTLHELRKLETDNRGLASGTQRAKYFEASTRSRTKLVPSAIIGAFDPSARFQYCRLTAWSGKENDKYRSLFPIFEQIADRFAEHVPERYAVQMGKVNATHPDWRIADTPFTTITVNNTYPTGVHTDAGDLAEGFSTLAVLRRGAYEGGHLVFPEYRVAVDMQHGDVLLMDAHEWHGNVGLALFDPECDWCDQPAVWRFDAKRPDTGKVVTDRPACDVHFNAIKSQDIMVGERRPVVKAERISIVCYYRTQFVTCGSAEEEAAKAAKSAEQRSGADLIDRMAVEAVGAQGG
jgi:hypothetical protein